MLVNCDLKLALSVSMKVPFDSAFPVLQRTFTSRRFLCISRNQEGEIVGHEVDDITTNFRGHFRLVQLALYAPYSTLSHNASYIVPPAYNPFSTQTLIHVAFLINREYCCTKIETTPDAEYERVNKTSAAPSRKLCS